MYIFTNSPIGREEGDAFNTTRKRELNYLFAVVGGEKEEGIYESRRKIASIGFVSTFSEYCRDNSRVKISPSVALPAQFGMNLPLHFSPYRSLSILTPEVLHNQLPCIMVLFHVTFE